ncbi:VWA domain-containing protein [Halosegnis sp.]|uniref:VWA domain-containing protein n=1 Tax=Halosegnis sp. TaxID=2864959 RepID=UPI0035D3EF5F
MIEQSTSEKDSGATFADVVGQTELKEALLAVATDDDLDGLLVEGEKGTAKSTAVRALGNLLPSQRVVADCPYACHPTDPDRQCGDCRARPDPPVDRRRVPVVTLPLGATRDRVVGTLSVADAMAGDAEFDPGLLARANRGVLYVDEVNLLDDHLVDTLLDAAASGRNRVERDGVSVDHPAEFTLVGTMNPEEGDLRPQLRDRFALHTTVTGLDDIDDRIAIIEGALRPEQADDRPDERVETGGDDSAEPAAQLARARELLADVELPDEFAADIAELCRDAGIDGHRGDIATARAARALAALDGRTRVLESDVRRAAELALSHRLQSTPFEDAPDPEEVVDDHFDDAEDGEPDDGTDAGGETESESDGEANGDGDEETDAGSDGEDGEEGEAPDGEPNSGRGDESGDPEADESDDKASSDDGDPEESRSDEGGNPEPVSAEGDNGGDADGEGSDSPAEEEQEATPLVPGAERAGIGEAAAPELGVPDAADVGSAGEGRGEAAATTAGSGSLVRTERASDDDPIDAAASIRAAAARGDDSVESRDLRRSVRASDAETLVLFVVDASASMRPAMRAAKGTVLELLQDAYEARDAVGFVAFAGEDGEVLLPPTDSVTLAARHLKELPTGDRTPLPAGLRTAGSVLDRADPDASVVVLVTDGRANVGESPVAETRAAAAALAERDPSVVVVDAGDEDDRGALVDTLVEVTDGRRVPLDALSAARVDAAARRN